MALILSMSILLHEELSQAAQPNSSIAKKMIKPPGVAFVILFAVSLVIAYICI
jgi:hypothetical protein